MPNAAPHARSEADAASCSAHRGNNLKDVDLEIPGRPVHLRHRRIGFGQVHPDQRHPVRLASHELNGASRTPRAVSRNRRAWSCSTRSSTSTSRRSAARRVRNPGDLHRPVHAVARIVRAGARGARARLLAGRFSFNVQRRPLRSLPRRRPDQGRDALPAGRLRALRCLQGQALQPRDAGNQLQGPQHPRRARHDGRGRAEAVRAGAVDRAQARNAGRCGPELHQARPVRDHAVGRRSAAREAVEGTVASATPAARCTCSTNRPPACTSTTSSNC